MDPKPQPKEHHEDHQSIGLVSSSSLKPRTASQYDDQLLIPNQQAFSSSSSSSIELNENNENNNNNNNNSAVDTKRSSVNDVQEIHDDTLFTKAPILEELHANNNSINTKAVQFTPISSNSVVNISINTHEHEHEHEYESEHELGDNEEEDDEKHENKPRLSRPATVDLLKRIHEGPLSESEMPLDDSFFPGTGKITSLRDMKIQLQMNDLFFYRGTN